MAKDSLATREVFKISGLKLHPNEKLEHFSGFQNDVEWTDNQLLGLEHPFVISWMAPETLYQNEHKKISATFGDSSAHLANQLFKTFFFKDGQQARNLPVKFFEERPTPTELKIEFVAMRDEEENANERVEHTIIAHTSEAHGSTPKLLVDIKVKGRRQKKEYNAFNANIEFRLKRKAFEIVEEHFHHPRSMLSLLVKMNTKREYRDPFRLDKELDPNMEFLRVANYCSTIVSLDHSNPSLHKSGTSQTKIAHSKRERLLAKWY